jgi:hypothetical protein
LDRNPNACLVVIRTFRLCRNVLSAFFHRGSPVAETRNALGWKPLTLLRFMIILIVRIKSKRMETYIILVPASGDRPAKILIIYWVFPEWLRYSYPMLISVIDKVKGMLPVEKRNPFSDPFYEFLLSLLLVCAQ